MEDLPSTSSTTCTTTSSAINSNTSSFTTSSRARRCVRCEFPGCDKVFPSKYFLKRHARCHSKVRNSSPTISLNTRSKQTSAGNENAKVVDVTVNANLTTENGETQQELTDNLEQRKVDPIPIELRQLGIDADWLLNPTPLETSVPACGHGTLCIDRGTLNIGHVMLLLQMKDKFDFRLSRMTKWLAVLGVDPILALTDVLNNHSRVLGENERRLFWQRPLIGRWDDSITSSPSVQPLPSAQLSPSTQPSHSIRPSKSVQPPSLTSPPPPPVVSSTSSSPSISSSSAQSPILSNVSFIRQSCSKLSESTTTSPLQSRVVSSFTSSAVLSSSLSSSSSSISSSAVAPSISSSSSPIASSTSVGEEPIEDIPLPTERICQTDPEVLSQIALPNPIPLHDIPLPELSTIPLPIKKQTRG